MNSIAQCRALYDQHTELKDLEGGLVVLAPDGTPAAGATVVLIHQDGFQDPFKRLEVTSTDAGGRAELEERENANHILIWQGDVPGVHLKSYGLARHRKLAGEGSMIVRLLPPAEVHGRVRLDGAPPPKDFALDLHFPYVPDWPTISGDLRDALANLNPPLGVPRVTLESNGDFLINGFTWPTETDGTYAPAELRWNDDYIFRIPSQDASKPPTRNALRSFPVPAPGEEIRLDLARGGWISGKITAGNLGSLDRAMELDFTLPFGIRDRTKRLTKKPPEQESVKRDGSFRFCVPMPFGPLDLLLETGLEASDRERALAQVFHVKPPAKLEGHTWSLGQLRFNFRTSRLLRFRDTAGIPLSGVEVNRCRIDDTRLQARPPAAPDPSGPTRLLVALPPPGSHLIASRRDFVSTTIDDFHTQDGAIDVTLYKSARLRLTTDLPGGLAANRLYAQLEAQAPALALTAADRTTALQERTTAVGTPITQRLIDARSKAPWSFTRSFGDNPSEPIETGPAHLDLVGITPNVPFHLRVFEATGTVFLDRDIPAFTVGESRELVFTLPAPASPVQGRVIDAVGAPVPDVEIHFGSPAPAHVATTDADGHFEITGLYQLEGELLVQSFDDFNYCGYPGANISGRLARTLLFARQFRFHATGETVIEVPPSEPLEVRLIDAAGNPSFTDWQVRLFDETGTDYLTGTSEDASDRSIRAYGTEYVIKLARPANQTTLLVATYLNATVKRSVPPGILKLDLTVPVLGAIRFQGLSRNMSKRINLVKFTPKDQAEPFYQWWGAIGNPPRLEDVPPGTYTLQLLGEVDDHTPTGRLFAPIEVTVQSGLTADVHVSR